MTRAAEFTLTQRRVLAALAELPPWPPTLRELARVARVRSPATILQALIPLRDAGLVTWVDRRPRTLTITQAGRVQAEQIRSTQARERHNAEARLFARTEVNR